LGLGDEALHVRRELVVVRAADDDLISHSNSLATAAPFVV
jgi:hypothetical protein